MAVVNYLWGNCQWCAEREAAHNTRCPTLRDAYGYKKALFQDAAVVTHFIPLRRCTLCTERPCEGAYVKGQPACQSCWVEHMQTPQGKAWLEHMNAHDVAYQKWKEEQRGLRS